MRAFLANVLSPTRPVDLDSIAAFCTSESSAHWAWPFVDIKQVEVLPNREGMELRQKIQQRIVDLNEHQHVFIKTHNRYGAHEGLPLIRPDLTVGAVYLLRDPRDVAVSLTHHWSMTVDQVIEVMETDTIGTQPQIGQQIFEIMGSWSGHVRSWTQPKPKNTLVLRYEDCVADTFGTFGRLAKMLKLTNDDNVIREAVEATAFKNLKKQEEEHGFRERPEKAKAFFRSGTAGGWRNVLRPQQVKRIEKAHSAMMQRFNYEPEFVDS
jgi:hypothetical protein